MSSGRGTFFSSYQMPAPTPGNLTCSYGTSCYNVSNEPSLNLTRTGLLAVAYTALTNNSQCPLMRSQATVEIGFSVSRNGGLTWSRPAYLGNPNCGQAQVYANAWQPSLTSLGNGTLVLAYIQSNYTYRATPPYVDCYATTFDRLVVSESFDNGSHWTTPTGVYNISDPTPNGVCPVGFPIERPWVTAYGQTLYLVWENLTTPVNGGPVGSSAVHLRVSRDGGTTWGAVRHLPTEYAYDPYAGRYVGEAMNPTITTDPSGAVFIAYATNLSLQRSCYLTYCPYYWHADVVVASSTNNGSSLNLSRVDNTTVPDQNPYGPFSDPSPQLAYSARFGQLYATYDGGVFGEYCYNYTYNYYYYGSTYHAAYPNCYYADRPTVFFANSSDAGRTWSVAHAVDPTLILPSGGPPDRLYRPALAVDASGRIHLEAAFTNASVCGLVQYAYSTSYYYNYTVCGAEQEEYFSSVDNGSSFVGPITVASNATPYSQSSYEWDGEYATMVAGYGHVWLGWVNDQCPTWNSSGCYYGGPSGSSRVVVSELYTGPGLAITFREKGLPNGTLWSAELFGNQRATAAPGTLSVSGVPPGEWLTWSSPWVNLSYGVKYQTSLNPPSPGAFQVNSTVIVTFDGFGLLNLTTFPALGYNVWASRGATNYNLTPLPSATWLPLGHRVNLSAAVLGNLSTSSVCSYYCSYYNLSFLSWTGAGPGSVNSVAPAPALHVAGAINETANFQFDSICSGYNRSLGYSPALACLNFTYPLVFHESGLPAGTPWAVTVGTNLTNESTGPWLDFEVGVGPVPFTVWSSRASTPNNVWVGVPSTPSPAELPIDRTINVTFHEVAPANATFEGRFLAVGLPAGTNWSVTIGNLSYGTSGPLLGRNVSGGPLDMNVTPIVGTNGTGYYPAGWSIEPFDIGTSPINGSSEPFAFSPNSSFAVTIDFRPMYLLRVLATVGGSAGPSETWVPSGGSVVLHELPNAGFRFGGWTGAGPGATTSAQANESSPVVSPLGAVTETAEFYAYVPLWSIAVLAAGLPTGQGFPVQFGPSTYWLHVGDRLGGIASGDYRVVFPPAYSNSSNDTRFVATSWSSSYGRLANGTLAIGANGSIVVTFGAQFALTVASTPHGSTSPPAGRYWFAAGSTVTLGAAPDPGAQFVSWAGGGSGAIASSQPSISVLMTGPTWESARFALSGGAAGSFTLTATETGLPARTTWSIAAGGSGIAGSASFLVVPGLNGTYPLAVPAVYISPDERFVAQAPTSVQVTADASVAVTFTEQFRVQLTSSPGGTVAPSGVLWVALAGSVNVRAQPNASAAFLGWNGTGVAACSSASLDCILNVTSPLVVVASFGPHAPPAPSAATSGIGSATVPLLLVAAVPAVVGVVLGVLVRRVRGFRRASPDSEVGASPPGEEVEADGPPVG